MAETRASLLAGLATRVADERVLAAIAAIPRDRFVPRAQRRRAWADEALPIGGGQTISQPRVVAHMCELLAIAPGDRVLDVGTGSGYHAAVLAALGARVWSIERDPRLTERAARSLEDAGVEGVTLLVGDGSQGHAERAPYDAINVAATARGRVPPALEEQLAPGGRLVAPVDDRLVVVRHVPGGRLTRADAGGVRFVPLIEGEP